MITVKLSDLVNSTETLQKLAQKDFKAKLAWSISRLLKAADAEIQNFNEARMELIKKYGEKDENGELISDENGNCKISPESSKDINTEIVDLINSDVEMKGNKLQLDLFEDTNFTPSDMAILEPFIEME